MWSVRLGSVFRKPVSNIFIGFHTPLCCTALYFERHLLCGLNAEAILRATGATRDEEVTANHSLPHSSSVSGVNSAKRLATSSRELGILGLPPEKMVLVREKKDDIEKVVCSSTRLMVIETVITFGDVVCLFWCCYLCFHLVSKGIVTLGVTLSRCVCVRRS